MMVVVLPFLYIYLSIASLVASVGVLEGGLVPWLPWSVPVAYCQLEFEIFCTLRLHSKIHHSRSHRY